jgi:hypothetical protein
MKKAVQKKRSLTKVTPKKKVAKKKGVLKMNADGNKTTVEKSQSVETVPFALEGLGVRSGEQSGDLQGLSNVEAADSESVDELLEEGNAFEADVVKGVEDAEDADEVEVHIHEVPQDDVPREYLDKE